MTSLTAILALGFVLGMRHATDADHVIAVTTIVSRERSARGAAAIGAAWGLGHSLTIFVIGSGIILFGWVIPERVGLSMEFGVGLMLIVLGVMSLRSVFGQMLSLATAPSAHSHVHQHGDYVHTHQHSHEPESHPHAPSETPVGRLDRSFGAWKSYRLLRPLVIGVVHGMAGSAAVVLLVLATIREPRWGVFYLVVFGLGTTLGMMLMTAAISLPFARTGDTFGRFNRGLRISAGVVSVAFGLFLTYRIGVTGGLFTGG